MKKLIAILLAALTVALSVVIVHAQPPIGDGAVYVNAECEVAAQLGLSAKSAVLIDAATGEVLFGKNSEQQLPMASTTKIVTAIVAINHTRDLTRIFTVHDNAIGVEGSSMYLFRGEQISMETLLFGLMLSSANDGATAIAYEIAGSVEGFAMLMNYTAARIGLTNTHFTNPHGLDHEQHFTTARELALITAYAMENDFFRSVVSSTSHRAPIIEKEGQRFLHNHNRLLRSYPGAIGVKTGFTRRSGRSLVSAAERDGLTLIAVTINAPNDWNDHRSMLDWGFERYRSVTLARHGELGFTIPIVGGDVEGIVAANVGNLTYRYSMHHQLQITSQINVPRMLFAPVREGQVVGVVIFFDGGVEVGRMDIIALQGAGQRVERQRWWARVSQGWSRRSR